MSFVLEHNIKAGSGIPTEDMKSFGELITVPFMYWGFWLFSLISYPTA